jgi:hypothetical protein
MAAFFAGAMVLAAPAAGGDSNLKLCDDIAARLRAHPEIFASKAAPLEALAKEGDHFVEQAAASHATSVDDKGEDAYVAALVSAYKADSRLAAAMKDQVDYQYDELWSLPASDVHALTSTSGSASCAQFLFFEGGHQLPDPPASMQGGMNDDRAGQIFECYRSRGDLARIGGRIVFAATDIGFENDEIGLRIVPLDHGRWGEGCRVAADFTVLYGVAEAHVAKNGALARDEWTKLALAIARAKDQAEKTKQPFAFGPAIAGHGARVAAVTAAKAGKMPPQTGFPLFGDSGDADQFDDGGEIFALVQDGRDALLRIAHPTIGWRDLPGYLMVLYALDDGKPVAVASASISARRGPLAAVRVSALEP